MVDTRLQGEYDVNSVWKSAEIAFKCTDHDSLQRPAMTEVVMQLQECLQLVEDSIDVEITSGSNNRFEMDQQNFKRALSMDNGPSVR